MSSAGPHDAQSDGWTEPVPIDRPSVPRFPVEVLPEPLRPWCSATAEATQTPVELAGLLSLAICSGSVARDYEIEAGRGWREPINLYVACLLEPANRKSAVFGAATKPLRDIEKALIEQTAPELARLAASRRIKEAVQREAEKKASSGCEVSRETALRLSEELSQEVIPGSPELLVDDATAEAIEMALASQGGRLIAAGCEGGIFDVMAGRYSSGACNLDAFLKGHAGDSLRVKRVTRGTIVVERCCLTLVYAVQPDVIRGLAAKPSFRGRGLIGRFLYAVPESPLGKRRVDPDPVPEYLTIAYGSLIKKLFDLRHGGDDPRLLSLKSAAAEAFRDWQREVETMLAEDGRLEILRDWGGKLCGLTARLAAVMHLVACESPDPWREPVGLKTIESAIALAKWAIPHAEAMLVMMIGSDDTADDARLVLRKIRENELATFSRRDVQNLGRRRFDGQAERLDAALSLLVELGWTRPKPGSRPEGPGRPPSPNFDVHPDVFQGRGARSLPPVIPYPVVLNSRVKGVI